MFEFSNLMSVVGLFTMLALAWAMSYHKTKVRLRPVIAGMSLQFLLAMMIMPDDKNVSFVGMGLLASLMVIYVLKEETFIPIEGPVRHVVHALIGGMLGAALFFLGAIIIAWLLGLSLLGLLLNSLWLKKEKLGRYGTVLFLSSSVAYLVATGMNGKTLFSAFTKKVETFLALSEHGSGFMFGFQWFRTTDNSYFPGFAQAFAFSVLPTIIFFGGVMSVLYYLGIVQKVVLGLSRFMRWSMGTSGSESLSCSANIFVGQTEAPLLVKPFLQDMTKSELLTIMVGGFATIAGGVLAGYISMGVDAGHLIAASVMSAPAALVISKIIYPELEHSATAGDVDPPLIPVADNVLEAAASGISDGLKLAMNVGAMLIGFIALIAVLDVLLNFMDSIIDGRLLKGARVEYPPLFAAVVPGEFEGIFPGSLQTLFGKTLKYLALLMGVPMEDATTVGGLLGVKLSINEFVAFLQLGTYINNEVLSPRGQLIATYALCGFANFSSIGIQIGGISALAPERRKDLSRVGLKAMFGGALASWTTACVAGIFFVNPV